MEKKWYQSKSCWGGLLAAFGGLSLQISGILKGDASLVQALPQMITYIGAGLSVIGIRLRLE
jgi:hypothetical protein